MGHKKITPEQKAEINRVYKETNNKTETSRLLGLSIATINRYTKPSKEFYTEQDKENVLKLYKTGNFLQNEIAIKLNVSKSFVQRVLKCLPKPKKPKTEKVKLQKTPNVKKLKAVVTVQKPSNYGKEVNIRKLEPLIRPKVYKKIRLDSKTEIETYSESEYQEKCLKYGI